MIKKLSNKDKKDWEKFIKGNDKIYNKDLPNKITLNKTGQSKTVDLHGFSLQSANDRVSKYIKHCFSNNIKKLTVITGKGLRSNTQNNPYVSKDLSILKNSVPEFIKSKPDLMKFIKEIKIANNEDGGSGAFNIYFKKFKE